MAGIISPERITPLNSAPQGDGPVLYWMSRDQRAHDNWALVYALEQAALRRVPCAVAFCVSDGFLGAQAYHYAFMLDGLRETAGALDQLNIPFFLLKGEPGEEVPRFAKKCGAGLVVCDFDPLKIKRAWTAAVSKKLAVPLVEVDAHNIVPCRFASPKREVGAYTLRPKLKKLLPLFLKPYPELRRQKISWAGPSPDTVATQFGERAIGGRPVSTHLPPSPFSRLEREAAKRLSAFLKNGLSAYGEARNDPSLDGQSGLSPYLHLGQLSAQSIALAASAAKVPQESKDAFLEELIVRRELSDNFCLYTPDYDSHTCFAPWATASLERELKTKREYLYSADQLEKAKTHDELWNAAQREMVLTGKMHGYMRMYWGKKILEWSKDYKQAYKLALTLNNRYELDGRDPNGYAGVAWAIGGVHDRPWPGRPVFGNIRFMSRKGCESKFDAGAYIAKIRALRG